MRRLLYLTLIVATALGTWVYSSGSQMHSDVSQAFGSFSQIIPQVLGESTYDQVQQKTQIRFVGDVMLARDVETIINTFGITYPFSKLPVLASSSYLIGNFEGSIPEAHTHTKDLTFSFSVNSSFVDALHSYGFTQLGLANNHSYDFGTDGFENTVHVLSDASLSPFGDPEHIASSSIPLVHVGSSTIAIVPMYAVNSIPSEKVITRLLQEATAQSDFQVVFIHWGTEYKLHHTLEQEKLAQEIIDAGADAIVGHHPHVVEDIGMYKSVPIFYSLGNFVFDQYFDENVQKGLMLDMTVDHSKLAFDLLPISSIGSRAAPMLMTGYERDSFLTTLAEKSDTSLAKMIKSGNLSF